MYSLEGTPSHRLLRSATYERGLDSDRIVRAMSSIHNRDRLHNNGLDRLVAWAGLDILNGFDDVQTLSDLAKDRVLGGRASVEVVEEAVVGCVDEEPDEGMEGL